MILGCRTLTYDIQTIPIKLGRHQDNTSTLILLVPNGVLHVTLSNVSRTCPPRHLQSLTYLIRNMAELAQERVCRSNSNSVITFTPALLMFHTPVTSFNQRIPERRRSENLNPTLAAAGWKTRMWCYLASPREWASGFTRNIPWGDWEPGAKCSHHSTSEAYLDTILYTVPVRFNNWKALPPAGTRSCLGIDTRK